MRDEFIEDKVDYDLRYANSNRAYYTDVNKVHEFITEIYTENGWEDYYIYTTISAVYKTSPGTYSISTVSAWDYYDTEELIAWDVSSVVNEFNEEIDPKNILTEAEYERYNTSLNEFILEF